MNLAFDRRDQSNINKVKLVGGIDPSNRLSTMNNIGRPGVLALVEIGWKRIRGDAPKRAWLFVRVDLPSRDAFRFYYQKQRRSKRAVLSYGCCRLASWRLDYREGCRSIGGWRLGEGREGDRAR